MCTIIDNIMISRGFKEQRIPTPLRSGSFDHTDEFTVISEETRLVRKMFQLRSSYKNIHILRKAVRPIFIFLK